MNQQELVAKLLEQFPNGKISCTEARKFALESQIELVRMGELCDEASIKIYGCELGCF